MEEVERELERLGEHDTWCVRAVIGEDGRPTILLICGCGKIVDRITDPIYEDEIYEIWSQHAELVDNDDVEEYDDLDVEDEDDDFVLVDA